MQQLAGILSPGGLGARGLSKPITEGGRAEKDVEDTPALQAKREKVRQEIIDTEQSYCRSLNTLNTEFIGKLRSEAIITEAQIQKIFGSIPMLAQFHSLFLFDLSTQSTSKVFLKSADFLKMYAGYVQGYTGALEQLNDLRGHHKFKAFLSARREEHNMDLLSFMIMPVQRVPRYVLLLAEMIKCTPKSHVEYTLLNEALTKVKQVAMHINDQQREIEKMTKVLEVQNKITGTLNLLEPGAGRHLIREGQLIKLGEGIIGTLQQRHFYLFNDLLLWTVNNKIKDKSCIELTHALLEYVGEGKLRANPLAFSLKHQNKELHLVAATEVLKTEWVNALEGAIKKLKAGRKQKRMNSVKQRLNRQKKPGFATLPAKDASVLTDLIQLNSVSGPLSVEGADDGATTRQSSRSVYTQGPIRARARRRLSFVEQLRELPGHAANGESPASPIRTFFTTSTKLDEHPNNHHASHDDNDSSNSNDDDAEPTAADHKVATEATTLPPITPPKFRLFRNSAEASPNHNVTHVARPHTPSPPRPPTKPLSPPPVPVSASSPRPSSSPNAPGSPSPGPSPMSGVDSSMRNLRPAHSATVM